MCLWPVSVRGGGGGGCYWFRSFLDKGYIDTISWVYTRVVRKVLRLCLYLKKYSSLENKTYTILKNSYLLICMQNKKIYVLI